MGRRSPWLRLAAPPPRRRFGDHARERTGAGRRMDSPARLGERNGVAAGYPVAPYPLLALPVATVVERCGRALLQAFHAQPEPAGAHLAPHRAYLARRRAEAAG